MKNIKKFIFFLLVVVSVLVISSCVSSKSSQPIPGLGFAARMEGKCFDLEDDIVSLDADYYLVYYAADWCPYCLEFQETLKQTYERYQRMYGNVQIIFAGHERDTCDQNMKDFLIKGGYSFPYVKYEYREETGIMKLVDVPKFWIPGFVLLDREGNVLSTSNGQSKEEYCRDCPLQFYETLQQCDCLQAN